MAFIKQESEDIKIEEVFSVRHEETEEQTGFTLQSDHTGTTNNYKNENGNEDRTYTADYCPQTSNEMDILESTDVMDSSSDIKEELYEFEMNNTEQQVSFSMKMSQENEEEEVAEEEQVAEGIQGKPLMEIDESAHGCGSQQHDVRVKMSSNSEQERIYDKKNYCLYCEKPYAKITRHLTQKHSEKAEVALALAHRQGSAKRNLLLSKVRNMGNYHHNSSVLSSGKGEIVPKRQATYKSTATDYLPCKFCFAMYVKKDLWRHHKRCKLQVQDETPVKRSVQTSCSLLLPMESVVSSGLQNIIEDMTDDTVTQVVKSDPLILSLGERMFLKNGEVGRHRADIRNKMRELARLLLVTRTIDRDIVALKDLIDPGKFNTVLEAVKKMTGFNNSTNRFSAPSTALKLHQSLVKVSYILQGEALRQEDDALKGRTEQFSKLIELEWPIQQPCTRKNNGTAHSSPC